MMTNYWRFFSRSLLPKRSKPPTSKELIQAVLNDNLQQLRLWLKLGYFNPASREFLDADFLITAARTGRIRILRWLLEHGAAFNMGGWYDRTALHEAIAAKQHVATSLLIAYGANINTRDDKQQTPLHIAVRRNNIADVALLLAHPEIDLNPFDVYGFNPLHYAIRYGRSEIAKMLITAGLSVNIPTQICSKTTLDLAVEHYRWVENLFNTPFYYPSSRYTNEERTKMLEKAGETIRFLHLQTGSEYTPNLKEEFNLLWVPTARPYNN